MNREGLRYQNINCQPGKLTSATTQRTEDGAKLFFLIASEHT